MTTEERFWSHVEKTPGCWLWTKYRDACGYGRFAIKPRGVIGAHIVAWEFSTGQSVPRGMRVVQACGQKSCVRPDHMEMRTLSKAYVRGKRKTIEEQFWGRVSKTDGCWLWTGRLGRTGYGRFKPSPEGLVLVHRFSWQMHNGPVPDDLRVLHRCDVRNCVRPDHLFLGTQADNVHDMHAKGRARKHRGPSRYKGEKNHLAKLTDADVLEIRRRAAEGAVLGEMARRYGVSAPTIREVVLRLRWTHVPDEIKATSYADFSPRLRVIRSVQAAPAP